MLQNDVVQSAGGNEKNVEEESEEEDGVRHRCQGFPVQCTETRANTTIRISGEIVKQDIDWRKHCILAKNMKIQSEFALYCLCGAVPRTPLKRKASPSALSKPSVCAYANVFMWPGNMTRTTALRKSIPLPCITLNCPCTVIPHEKELFGKVHEKNTAKHSHTLLLLSCITVILLFASS